MKEEFSLSLDVGSSCVKLSVFSSTRGQLYFSEFSFFTNYKSESEVEFEGEALWLEIESNLQKALSSLSREQLPHFFSLSTQRESVLLWSRKTGKALTPVLSWQDSRMDDFVSSFSTQEIELIRSKTGLWLSSYCSAPKLNYLLGSLAPELSEDYLWGTLDSWLIYRLSRGKYFVTDYSSASRTALLSLETLSWDSQLFELFKIPFHSLPRLVENDEEIGTISIEGCELTLKGVFGDQQAALYSTYKLGLPTTSLVYGTGAFVLKLLPEKLSFQEVSKRYFSQRSLITLAWKKGGEEPRFALELSFSNSAQSLNWLCREFDLSFPSNFNLEGLDWGKLPLCYPFLSGRWFLSELNSQKREASFVGLNLNTRREELLFSFIEGLAFSIRRGIEELEIDASIGLTVGGGLIESETFLVLQACCLKFPLSVVLSGSLSGLGASLCSFSSFEVEKKSRIVSPVTSLSDVVEKRYLRWLQGTN